MSLTSWLRQLFSSEGPEAEAAEREEYGLPDRSEAEAERERFRGPLISEGNPAEEELEAFEPPPDPDP